MSAVTWSHFLLNKYFSCIFCTLIIACVTPVQAVEFDYGEVYGSFDTTVSYGQIHRVQSRASELIGDFNDGTAFSVNGDDGNLNYDTGLVSSTLKFTSELELRYKNFGAFLRGTGFHDFSSNVPGDGVRTDLTDDAIELVGEDIKLLDAYVWAGFDIGDSPVNIRLGEQVISWGESTFIQNSINVINPVDVSKLRLPGSELKEALLPVGIISASLGVTDNISLEAYWQYDYERIRIDPPGSYFSTNDFVGDGGNCAVLGFGVAVPDYPFLPLGDRTTNACGFAGTIPGSAPRSPDNQPDQGEEYGVAIRLFVPQLNDTEFGFYHINYHSRLPIINSITPSFYFLGPPGPANLGGATYFISYPEDIKLYGVSFNTQVGTSGWALQGEYSFRDDAPLQVDDAELLLATLGVPLNQLIPFGAFPNSSVIDGFILRDVSQFQMTASRVFGPMLKASQAIFVAEVAVTHVHDMPDKNTLRLEAPGTNLPGPFFGFDRTGFALGVQPNGDFADATSWGYRMVGRLDYNNVVGAINLHPRIEWRHDVSGITPGPGGNFVEGNKVVTASLGASYQNAWQADLSYTSFLGDDAQNLLYDRDFLSLSVSYSF